MLRFAGRAYIAGTELHDALSVSERLRNAGYASTIAYWDRTGESPEEVLKAYTAAIRSLAGFVQKSAVRYLSVKAPSLNYDRAAFLRLAGECAAGNVRMHFDSLGPETVESTFRLVDELLPEYRNLSITLPGQWSRSVRDAEWTIQRKLAVRVVKGQWPDTKGETINPVQGYLNVVGALAGRAIHVAVASHNPVVVRHALRQLLDKGTSCELELLYGLPVEHVLLIARQMRVRARIYIPYGYGWLPYSLSQAKRNPRIFWWMLKDMMQGNHRGSIYRR